MKIGFTGSHKGMSASQAHGFSLLLISQGGKDMEFHHGDCVGADETADQLVRGYWAEGKLVIHPPIKGENWARCGEPRHGKYEGTLEVEVRPQKDYLSRDRDIVNACDFLIACPLSLVEVNRSGTWYTIRYARKQEIPVIILD